jgi:hypothetical protein
LSQLALSAIRRFIESDTSDAKKKPPEGGWLSAMHVWFYSAITVGMAGTFCATSVSDRNV